MRQQVVLMTLFAVFVLLVSNLVVAQNQNYALSFDGVDDYVEVPYNPSFPVETFTLSAWINSPTADGKNCRVIIAFGEDVVTDNGPWYFYLDPQGYLALELEDRSEGNHWYVSDKFIADGRWHQVAATQSATGKVNLFVDGLVVKTFLNTAKPSPNSQQSIGIGCNFGYDGTARTPQPPGDFFKGAINEVRIYNYTQEPADIKKEMSRRLRGCEPGLVAYYNFDEGSGQVLSDLSPNKNHGRLGRLAAADVADPQWVTSPLDLKAPLPVGDVNGDCQLNIADPIYLLSHLFVSGPPPVTDESAEVNCDERVNIADAVYLIYYLFAQGPELGCP